MIWGVITLVAALAGADAPPANDTLPATESPAVESSGLAATSTIDAGLAAFKRRRYAQAEEQFEKAVAAEPGSAAAHFYLGYVIYKRAEPKRPFHPDKQRAAAEFAKAFELDPAFSPAWHKAASVSKTKEKAR